MRRCGPCAACCTVLTVPGVSPAGQPCPHLAEQGCGIYAQRPDVCRTWSCQWIQDNLHRKPARLFLDSERPDRLGVMFDITPDARLVAHELRPGAFDAAAGTMERVEARNRVVRLPYA